MGKIDKILKTSSANIYESMGADRERPLPGSLPPTAQDEVDPMEGLVRIAGAAEVPVDKIDRDPSQPREEFDQESLGRLAESMKTRGQIQPIQVRWDGGRGRYVIICGERRWRAAKIAGMKTMSCIVVDRPMSEADLLAIQYIENALREDLRPIEQAKAFRSLIDLNGWSGNQLARELSIGNATVSRVLALLELPDSIQHQVEQGAIPATVAYEVGKIEDAEVQAQVAARVVSEKLNRAEAIEAVREARPKVAHKSSRPQKVTAKTMRTSTGHRVTIEHKRGVDDAGVFAACHEIASQLKAKFSTSDEAA